MKNYTDQTHDEHDKRYECIQQSVCARSWSRIHSSPRRANLLVLAQLSFLVVKLTWLLSYSTKESRARRMTSDSMPTVSCLVDANATEKLLRTTRPYVASVPRTKKPPKKPFGSCWDILVNTVCQTHLWALPLRLVCCFRGIHTESLLWCCWKEDGYDTPTPITDTMMTGELSRPQGSFLMLESACAVGG